MFAQTVYRAGERFCGMETTALVKVESGGGKNVPESGEEPGNAGQTHEQRFEAGHVEQYGVNRTLSIVIGWLVSNAFSKVP